MVKPTFQNFVTVRKDGVLENAGTANAGTGK